MGLVLYTLQTPVQKQFAGKPCGMCMLVDAAFTARVYIAGGHSHGLRGALHAEGVAGCGFVQLWLDPAAPPLVGHAMAAEQRQLACHCSRQGAEQH